MPDTIEIAAAKFLAPYHEEMDNNDSAQNRRCADFHRQQRTVELTDLRAAVERKNKQIQNDMTLSADQRIRFSDGLDFVKALIDKAMEGKD